MHVLTSEAIHIYCEQCSTPETDLLYDLNRQTHLKTNLPVMLSGHLQGRVLSMLSKMIQPQYVLEIGTFTGYSALCLAEGLKPEGKLVTLEADEEQASLAASFIKKSAWQHQIELLVGRAADLIPSLNYPFDLVFIDADKINYSLYFDLVIDNVKPGGYILADNVLFHGEVLNEPVSGKNAKAIHAFNEYIKTDDTADHVLLTVRDGIMMIQKK
mgnify:CR=1 FL=1